MDLLRIIQLGLTFADEQASTAFLIPTGQIFSSVRCDESDRTPPAASHCRLEARARRLWGAMPKLAESETGRMAIRL